MLRVQMIAVTPHMLPVVAVNDRAPDDVLLKIAPTRMYPGWAGRIDGVRLIMIQAKQLVAHRGFPRQYPENSLPGITAAIETGALWLEWDVQLSADLTPMVIHDTSLERTAKTAGDVRKIQASELSRVPIGQLAEQGPVFIPELKQAVNLVAESPGASVFVELKTESVDYFGREPVLKAILPVLKPLGPRNGAL